MTRARPRRLVLRCLAAIAVAHLATACTSSHTDDAAKSSKTPAIKNRDDGTLADHLLTAEDVAAMPFLGGLAAQPIDSADVFEDPDPRGPCGGASPPLPSDDRAGRAFVGQTRTVVHLVSEGAAAVDLVDAHLADIHEPCGPYDSKTNTGSTQHVHDIAVRPLEDGIGYALTAIIDSEGQTFHVFGGMTRAGQRVSAVFGLSQEAMDLDQSSTVVRRAHERLMD